jgi:methionyl-tRNA formyltransferase
MKIVFMGTADFGLPALQALRESGHAIAGIVTAPERPKGRGLKPAQSPVARFALQNGLSPVYTPASLRSPEFIEVLKTHTADLFVVVAFRLLPREVFLLPPLGTVNIHASLLPKFRGPAPIQRAIEHGEKETGVTVFRINEGIDTGNIILQKKTPIGDEETAPQIYARLSVLGAACLLDVCAMLENGTAAYALQDEALATPAPKLSKEEGALRWGLPARTLFNKIRAFKPFPGTYTFLGGKRVSIERAAVIDGRSDAAPGTICGADADCFDIQCGDGCLRIMEVKPEGKPVMNARAFMLGRNLAPGTRFD